VFLRELVKQLGIDAADILLLSPHTNNLKWFIGQGFRSNALQYTELKIGQGYAGKAALERRVLKIENLTENLESLSLSKHLHEERFTTYFGVPLIAKGEVQGVLEIFHRRSLYPDREWLSFLDSLATHAAIAIDNATLFSNLQQSNTELTIAYDTSIEGWAKALDLRDRETEGHSRRVTAMTLDMAEEIGIDDTDMVHIRRGALLHDIGKMGIPDNILLKPGPLTEEEWKIMKCHPQYAYELLSPIKYLVPAVDIPYCHHEKWDGTGYPRSLKGENIPLAARVFSIVDVWDALSSDRPYRKAWDISRVLDHVKSLSGTDFEPDLVRLFFQCLEKKKKSRN
ncbi:MAG: HD-GYP domain-containing protein, partial [Nitrospinota bacterium]